MTVFERAIVAVTTVLVGMGVGCGDAPSAEPATPKVQVVSGHARAPAGAFQKAAFSCCSNDEATAAVRAFSAWGATLAADDEAGASQGAAQFAAALEGAKLEEGSELGGVLSEVRAAKGIDSMRAAYLKVSVPMIAYAKAHRGGSDRVALAYCPMKPGRWLQAEEELANPYYGAQMLRCGTFESIE